MLNNSSHLLANSKGQPLKEHSLAVAFYGHLLLKSLKFKPEIEKPINKCLILSSLLHDIGKVSKSFQDYIKKHINKENNDLEDFPTDAESMREKSFKGPYHNEISWAYIANFIKIENYLMKNIIRHSVYWHHPANWDEKTDGLRFKDSEKVFNNIKDNSETINEMYRFVSDLFCSFYKMYGEKIEGVDFCSNPASNNIDMICPSDFFSHKLEETAKNAKKQLCLNLLLEADRVVSKWEVDRLKSFLKQIYDAENPISLWNFKESEKYFNLWNKSLDNTQQTKVFPIKEELKTNAKSKEQFSLAERMSDKKYSICGVDPAGGKTSIALYWWSKCNNKTPLMIALPRQHQVTGLFGSLKKDIDRIYSTKEIKIEGVFNGKRQESNWHPPERSNLLISNINIMVFDRFLSPYYKRTQSSEFIKMLSSHLVLDEFHEFKNIPKMIPSLKEILIIREWLISGVKTLMLSGTPEPPLLKLLSLDKNNIFKREELSQRTDHKFKLSIVKESELKDTKIFTPDSLYSFLRVEACQKVFAEFYSEYQEKIRLIHSYFTSKDKKHLLEEILKDHGFPDGKFLSKKSVVTAKMLQSSYNLSFSNAFVELSQPDIDCQTAGRVNRFESKLDAKIKFFYNEETENFFNPSKADFKEIHQNWKAYLMDFIKNKKDQLISIRDLMKVYDNFWEDESNIKKALCVLKKQQEKAITDMNKWTPKRFFKIKKRSSLSFNNNLFRGESLLLSACRVNDKVEPEDQLKGEDLLSEGRIWFIQKIKDTMKYCLKAADSCKSANKINNEDIFDYNKHISKYASFGYIADRPLLCSHFNQNVDKCFEKNLKSTDTQQTYYHVYHKKYGLVKKHFLDREIKK